MSSLLFFFQASSASTGIRMSFGSPKVDFVHVEYLNRRKRNFQHAVH